MQPGTVLQHYRILSRIGEGGMGVVYRAEDLRLGRTVALKVLRQDLAGDPERLRRFHREARAASAIAHPGIATLYDIQEAEGTVFFTMEYVEGRTLKALLADGPLPLARLLDCLLQVAEALAAAHRKGIIHRDLKPENVMAAESGFYKILDFGLARMDPPGFEEPGQRPTQLPTASLQLTVERTVLGTFAYMSPEQAQGEPLDARSDVFSFGSLMYELATGMQPFRARNVVATFHAIVHQEPEPLAALRPDLPPALVSIAARCLAKDPAARYADAAEVAGDLRSLRDGSAPAVASMPSMPWVPLAARPAPEAGPEPGRRRPTARGWGGLAGAAAAVLAAAGGIAFWTLPAPPPGTASVAPGSALPATAVPAAGGRLVVTFFANRTGSPEDDWLARGIPEMLTTDLARTPGLDVISTQRVDDLLDGAGWEEDRPLDAATARLVARWTGAALVVSGSIFRVGDGYRIDAQAHETTTGRIVAAARAEGSEVLALADQVAGDLRSGLQGADGPAPRGRQGPIASPEAYRAYSRGLEALDDLRLKEAEASFGEAVRRDPSLLQARLQLGTSLLLLGDRTAAAAPLRAAAAGADALPERDALLAQALVALFVEPDPAAADRTLQEIARRYPDDVEGTFWRVKALAGMGAGPGERIALLRRVISGDPGHVPAVAALAAELEGLGLVAEAEAIRADLLARRPELSGDRLREFSLAGG